MIITNPPELLRGTSLSSPLLLVLPAARSWWRDDPNAAAERGNNCEAPWGRNDTPAAGLGGSYWCYWFLVSSGFPDENDIKTSPKPRGITKKWRKHDSKQKVEKTYLKIQHLMDSFEGNPARNVQLLLIAKLWRFPATFPSNQLIKELNLHKFTTWKPYYGPFKMMTNGFLLSENLPPSPCSLNWLYGIYGPTSGIDPVGTHRVNPGWVSKN